MATPWAGAMRTEAQRKQFIRFAILGDVNGLRCWVRATVDRICGSEDLQPSQKAFLRNQATIFINSLHTTEHHIRETQEHRVREAKK